MILIINDFCFFDKYSIGSVKKLQKYFGVSSSSYAGNVAERLYYQFFGNSFNLEKYYHKYYKKEFKTCEEFIECRLNINKDYSKNIAKKHTWFSNMKDKNDNVIYSFENEQDLVKIFSDYVGGIINENTDGICN